MKYFDLQENEKQVILTMYPDIQKPTIIEADSKDQCYAKLCVILYGGEYSNGSIRKLKTEAKKLLRVEV